MLTTFHVVMAGVSVATAMLAAPPRSSSNGSQPATAQTASSEMSTTPGSPTQMMPSVAPLFLEGSGFSSTLNIINEAKVGIVAQVDIYSLDGSKVATKSVPLAPFGLQQVSLKSLLADASHHVDAGSIRVTSDHDGAMLAALALTHHGITDTYFDEELAMPSMDGSTVLRGVTDNVIVGSPLLAISSLAGTIQRVTVTCLRERGAAQTHTFDLAPNQTLLAEACASRRVYPLLSAADLDANNFETGLGDVGEVDKQTEGRRGGAVGIAIQTDGMPGELAAYGITPHSSRHEVFYSALNFTDPKMRMSSGVAYTGIPVGSSRLFPEGEYTPELALANFGSGTRSVTVASATTVPGSAPQKRVLATFSLPAASVRTLKLDQMLPDSDLQNSVVIHSDGTPGDIATKLISRSSSSPLHTIEMLEREESKGENGGGHPWTIEDGITSVLLLFNHDPKENRFNVRFGTHGEPWMKTYMLAPMETRSININALIRNQEKDDSGHALPLDVRSGEVGWQSDSTEVGGRVLQASPARAMARNFSCGSYVSMCAIYISPYTSLNFGYGNNGDLGSMSPTWDVFGLHPPTSCSCSGGSPTSSTLSLSYAWSSGNSSIATITSGATSTLSVWHAAGGGSTTGNYSAHQSTYNIQCVGQAPVKTQIPTSLSVVSSKGLPPNGWGLGCNPGDYGFQIDVVYQVLDQDGLPMMNSSMEPQEEDLNYIFNGTKYGDQLPDWGDILGGSSKITAGKKYTDGNGKFEDAPFGVCATAPFTATWTQPISVLLNGNRYTVRTNSWTQTGTGVAKGKTTNGKDVTVTQ